MIRMQNRIRLLCKQLIIVSHLSKILNDIKGKGQEEAFFIFKLQGLKGSILNLKDRK